jgi:excisionase family DNA binding protein
MSIFISVKDAAQILGVSTRTVCRLMDMGILPSVCPWGSRRKILRKDFEAWLQNLNEHSGNSLGEGECTNGAHT